MFYQAHTPLTGENLLQMISHLADFPREYKARMCGYVNVFENGIEHIDMVEFIAAVLEANGIHVGASEAEQTHLNSHENVFTVDTHGCMLITPEYIRYIAFQPRENVTVSPQAYSLSFYPHAPQAE